MKRIVLNMVLAVILMYTHAGFARAQETAVSESQTSAQTDLQSGAASVQTTDQDSSDFLPNDDTTTEALVVASLSAESPYLDSSSINVDPHTGSVSTGIQISVPQGRGGIEPNLSLVYNSTARNGKFGFGWMMELGAISRSTKFGVPNYDSTDTFVLMQNGSAQELVFDSATGRYHPEIESAFMKIEFISNQYWQVTDRSGTKYIFGQTPDAQEYDPSTPSRIYKWALESVEDIHGNTMTFSYDRQGNMLYPDTIDYTGHTSGLAPFAQVQFIKEDRTSDIAVSYIAGFEQTTDKRISQIDVYAAGVLQRSYDLTYQESILTGRSLLKYITQVAADGSTLPSTEFFYNETDLPGFDFQTYDEVPATGDNLWNARFDGSFDYGHDNFGPVPGFPNLGETYTQASGDGACGHWDITAGGSLSFNSSQDCGNVFWTYIYSPINQNLTVPYTHNELELGIYINGDYDTVHAHDWPLKEGYNLILLTAYHQHQSFNFNLNFELGNSFDPMSSSQASTPLLFGDYNGDGFTDKGEFDQSSGDVAISLSDGSTFAPKQTWISGFATDKQIMSGDFNRDGLTDIVAFDEVTGNWYVAISDGSQFIDQGVWLSGFGDDEESAFTGDFNGDGLTDVLTFYNSSGSVWRVRVALNDGTSFVNNNYVIDISGISEKEPFSGDFNADGLMDFGKFTPTSGDWVVQLNKGAGETHFPGTYSINGFGAGFKKVIADINSDGLTDLGYYDDTDGTIQYRLNNGAGFDTTDNVLPINFSLLDDTTQVQSVDFNGDGLSDFMAFDSVTGQTEVAFSYQGEVPDILLESHNGVGGSTFIDYVPSTVFDNNILPFVLQVADTITVSNNLGDSYTTRYSYADGYYNAQSREFRGFGFVRTIDVDGNYSESTFLQDDLFKGRPQKQETFDQFGNLYAKSENIYDTQNIMAGVDFVFLKRTDSYVFDGDVTGRRTAVENFYEESPQYGNLTKVVQLGEVDLDTGADIGVDSRTVETQYHNNTSNWLLGLAHTTTTKDHAGNPMRQSEFFYDGATDHLSDPTLGLLTQKLDWAGDGANDIDLVTQYSYDTYGNLKTTTDGLNHTTTIDYDPYYYIFPVTTTNAFNHQVINEYYGVNGVAQDAGDGTFGLWGQLRSTTDPNNVQGFVSYDAFGRETFNVGPMDSIAYPTQMMEYDLTGSFVRVTQHARIKHGQAPTIDSTTFYDGLGRMIQSKSRSETSGQFIVSGQVKYNERGLPVKQYVSRFTTNPLSVLDPIDPNVPYAEVEYDAMGRAITQIAPDGSYSSVEYDDWKTITTNANGHKQESDVDAYGRLVEKREYLGSDGRSAHYPNTGYSLYATTQYVYDSEGSLLNVVDEHGNTTSITYDKLGRKVTMDDPDMGDWQYAYDANGNLAWQIDASGKQIDFNYDALNRLENKTDQLLLDVDYVYDDVTANYSKGRLTSAQYGTQDETDFSYDMLGREVLSVKRIDNVDHQIARDYDALNRLTRVEYPDAAEVYYSYNQAGQIEVVAQQEVDIVGSSSSAEYLDAAQIHLKLNDNSNDLVVDNTGVLLDDAALIDSNDCNNLLLHGNGLQGSNIIIDEAGNTVNNFGVSVDTSIKQLGNGSLYFDGAGDYLSLPDSPNWDFGANLAESWTIDFWMKFDGLQGSRQLLTQYQDNANFWQLYHGNNGTGLGLQVKAGGVYYEVLSPASPITDSNWHHIAVVKVGDQYGLYKDGQQISYGQTSLTFDFSAEMRIGILETLTNYFRGHLDEIRIAQSNDLGLSPNAGLTDSFTPPQEEYTCASTQDISVAGKINQAFDFDSTHAVEMNSMIADIRNDSQGTMAFWFNTSQANTIILGAGSTQQDSRVTVFTYDNNGENQLAIGGYNTGSVNYTVSADFPLNDNQWYHGVITQDGNQLKMYIDGDQKSLYVIGGANQAMWFSSITSATMDYLLLGARFSHTQQIETGFFDGKIDDFRYYDFALDQAEIDTLYNNGNGTEEEAPQTNAGAMEDFTLFTAVDPNNEFDVTSNCVNFTDIEPRNSNAFVYRDYGDIGDFTHEVVVDVDAHGYQAGPLMVWGVSDTPDGSYQTWNNGIAIAAATGGGTPYHLEIKEVVDGVVSNQGSSYSYPLTKLYLTIQRTNDQFSVTVYDNAAKTNPVQTMVVSLTTADMMRYIYALGAYDAGESAHQLTGSVCNLEVMQIPSSAYVKNVNYNAQGQITKIEYGNGSVTTYSYDPEMFRLTQMVTTDTITDTDIQDLSYTYDSAGNILTITDAVNTATQTFTYDALSRLKTATGAYGSKTYDYDEIGNLKVKDGLTYNYGENGYGPHMVTSLSDGTTFDYDANGNMTAMNDPVDSFTYEYDAENRLTRVKKNGTIVSDYEYDGDGGRTKKTEYLISGVPTPPTPCFLAGTPVLMADGTYKPIEEITEGDEVLAYDETSMQTVTSIVTKTFEHHNIDEHLVINDHLKVTAEHEFFIIPRGDDQKLSSPYGENPGFRPAGELGINDKLLSQDLSDVKIEKIERVKLDKSITVYDFEVATQHNYFVLIGDRAQVLGDSSLTSNTYNLTPHNGSLKNASRITQDASHGVAVLVHNQTAVKQRVPTKKVTRFIGSLYDKVDGRDTKYVFLGDRRIAGVSEGLTYYLHADHLGGTNVLQDEFGNVKELMEYKPFGEFSRHEKFGTDEEVANYYFTGQYKDDESGLYFYNARYYNAKLGRFIQADTIVPYADDAQSFNRYTYVRNNPVNLVDPSGHFFFTALAWLAGFIATHWAAIATGALIGAALGGITAAATGGNVIKGVVTGAISGAIFGGVGSFLEGAKTIGELGKAIAHTMAGGVSGGINSVVTGDDFAMAVIVGAFSAGASKFLGGGKVSFLGDQADNTFAGLSGNFARRSIIGATVGGFSAEIAGGSFKEGAKKGALTSGIAYLANDVGSQIKDFLKGMGSYAKGIGGTIRQSFRLRGFAGKSEQMKAEAEVLIIDKAVKLSWEILSSSDSARELALELGLSHIKNNTSYIAGRAGIGYAVTAGATALTSPAVGIPLGVSLTSMALYGNAVNAVNSGITTVEGVVGAILTGD